MKKVFISVGMRGRTDEDVMADIKRAKLNISNMFDDVKIIDNWDCECPDEAVRLYCLGEAIKKLGDCDICYFVKGWQKHKGCIVEMEVCKLYGIEIVKEGV